MFKGTYRICIITIRCALPYVTSLGHRTFGNAISCQIYRSTYGIVLCMGIVNVEIHQCNMEKVRSWSVDRLIVWPLNSTCISWQQSGSLK